MASFADLSANLKLNIQDFSSKLKQASTDLRKFSNKINGETVSGMKELNTQTVAWGLNMKSISRVVSGILISQAFYGMVQQIRSATDAVWDFSKQLEYAQIAYSNLFGDTGLANEFINVLKDFAAKTPFSFTEAEKSAKRLLAYGIQYKNVMYVMQGVMAAASMQGDPAKIEQITRAIGQISTYGKLMSAEVRQLTEAGIPVYDILQEKLGLTQEQLRNLGDQAIPASVAINALIDGMNERFGNVVAASSRTISGIISNIKDNATMLFAGLFNPLTVFLKSALNELGEFLYAMREIYELKGIGGVFEAVFPPEMHATIRLFVANLGNLLQAVLRLAYAVSSLLRPAFEAFMAVFNAFSPILTTVINVFASLVQLITQNATVMKYLTAAIAAAAAMWVVYKAKALATAVVTGVINAMSKALAALHTMLTFVLTHPFWALLIGLTGVLVGLSIGFGKLGEKVSSFFSKLTQFNGIDPDKILLPSQKERANDLDKFNKKLDGTSDAMDNLADSTGKATKAAKGLLSFDEVFKLKQPDEGTDKGIGNIELPDFGDIELPGTGDVYIPEIPDFSDYMKNLTGGFLDKLKAAWEAIKDKIASIISTVIGAAFGALMGALLGGKLGGIIGALVGAIAGYFWNKLADYFGLSPEQKINAAIATGIATILGAILGGIIGGPLGAKIGAIAGSIVGSFWGILAEAFGLTPEEKTRAGIVTGILTALGAILGGIIAGPLGAKIGSVIGAIVGSFWGLFAEALGVLPEQQIATVLSGAITGLGQFLRRLFIELGEGLVVTFTDDVFSGFSRVVGFSFKEALTGALKQGAAGAVVGLVTGMLANALTAWIANELGLVEQDLKNSSVGQTIGSIIGSIVGIILGGPVGSLVGGALGQLAGSVIGEFWSYMSTTLKGTVIGGAAGLPIGAIVGALVGSIGGPLGAAIGGVVGAALGTLIGLIVDKWDVITGFFSGVGETISEAVAWLSEGFTAFGEAISSFFNGEYDIATLGTAIKDTFNGAKDTILDFGNSVLNSLGGVGTFIRDIFTGIGTFFSDIGSAITTVWTDIHTAVTTVLTDLWTAISTVWNDIKTAITTVLTDVWSAVTTVWNDISTAISTVCSAIWEVILNIWYLIRDLIVKVVTDIWNAIVEWFTPIAEEISRICAAIWNTVSKVFADIFNTIKTVVTNIWNTIKTVFTGILNTIKPILTSIWNVVKTIFTNIWNTVKTTVTNTYNTIKTIFTNIYNVIKSIVSNIYNNVKTTFSNIYNSVKTSISNMYNSVKSGISNIYNTFTNWISNMWNNVFGKLFGWINEGISKLREFFGLSSQASSVSIPSRSGKLPGHATGGIFNREHVARFSEGNKAEAIIPLENTNAMQPFVDAVANGLTASLAPILANFNGGTSQQQLQPLYVGTLIADERSLKELERKMEVIRLQESKR